MRRTEEQPPRHGRLFDFFQERCSRRFPGFLGERGLYGMLDVVDLNGGDIVLPFRGGNVHHSCGFTKSPEATTAFMC